MARGRQGRVSPQGEASSSGVKTCSGRRREVSGEGEAISGGVTSRGGRRGKVSRGREEATVGRVKTSGGRRGGFSGDVEVNANGVRMRGGLKMLTVQRQTDQRSEENGGNDDEYGLGMEIFLFSGDEYGFEDNVEIGEQSDSNVEECANVEPNAEGENSDTNAKKVEVGDIVEGEDNVEVGNNVEGEDNVENVEVGNNGEGEDIMMEEPMQNDEFDEAFGVNADMEAENVDNVDDNSGDDMFDDDYIPDPLKEDDEDRIDTPTNNGNDEIFAVSKEFNFATEFKDALLRYSLKTQYDIKLYTSSSLRLAAKCTYEGCPWSVYCSYDKNIFKMVIKIYNPAHSCVRSGHSKMLKCRSIASLFEERRTLNPKIRPKDMEKEVKREYNLNVSEHQCTRAKWYNQDKRK